MDKIHQFKNMLLRYQGKEKSLSLLVTDKQQAFESVI